MLGIILQIASTATCGDVRTAYTAAECCNKTVDSLVPLSTGTKLQIASPATCGDLRTAYTAAECCNKHADSLFSLQIPTPRIELKGETTLSFQRNCDQDYIDQGLRYWENDILYELRDKTAWFPNGLNIYTTGQVDMRKTGHYSISYSLKVGLHVLNLTRHVTVYDNDAPHMRLLGAQMDIVFKDDSYVDPGALSQDDWCPTVDTITSSNPPNTSAVGTYYVIYKATDGSNNTATVVRIVNVIDKPQDDNCAALNPEDIKYNGVKSLGSCATATHVDHQCKPICKEGYYLSDNNNKHLQYMTCKPDGTFGSQGCKPQYCYKHQVVLPQNAEGLYGCDNLVLSGDDCDFYCKGLHEQSIKSSINALCSHGAWILPSCNAYNVV